MINGFHALLHSDDPTADRVFLRDKLSWPYVDAHEGWLIFALPPAELGVHPGARGDGQQFFLMCDDVVATIAELAADGVDVDPEVIDEGPGLFTSIRLPGGGKRGLYEPRHPVATGLR